MEKYKKIVSFYPFELNIAKDVFSKKFPNLTFELFKNLKVDNIEEILFLGVCAGNLEKVNIGDIFIVSSIIDNYGKMFSVDCSLNSFRHAICESKSTPYFIGEKINADIFDMESYKIYKKYGSSFNCIRIVTDFGIDKNLSIKNYKKNIYNIYVNSLNKITEILKKKV